MQPTLQITVNNQPIDVEVGSNLHTLLKQLQVLDNDEHQGMALAVNRQIISRSRWLSYELNSGDDVTLIKATAGG